MVGDNAEFAAVDVEGSEIFARPRKTPQQGTRRYCLGNILHPTLIESFNSSRLSWEVESSSSSEEFERKCTRKDRVRVSVFELVSHSPARLLIAPYRKGRNRIIMPMQKRLTMHIPKCL